MSEIHFNYSMCKSCGGKCCQRYAGSYIPSDLKEPITVDLIVSKLKSGKFAIDWWEGDASGKNELDATYFVRPRHVNERAINGSYGGVCVNWSKESGCSLTEADRPHQCKHLIPNKPEGCYSKTEDKATKQDCAIAWIPFQEILEEAIDEYRKSLG